MVVEWLKFRVKPQKLEEFLEKDAQIWTAALENLPGFLGKEVWIDPNVPQEAICVIRWATKEQWKSIPQSVLEKTEREFARVMGKTYEMVETLEYQVCPWENPRSLIL